MEFIHSVLALRKTGGLSTMMFKRACVLSSFSRVQLCDPTACSPPDSSVHGILQARRLEWVAISSSRGSSQPREWTSPALLGRFFITSPPEKPIQILDCGLFRMLLQQVIKDKHIARSDKPYEGRGWVTGMDMLGMSSLSFKFKKSVHFNIIPGWKNKKLLRKANTSLKKHFSLTKVKTK